MKGLHPKKKVNTVLDNFFGQHKKQPKHSKICIMRKTEVFDYKISTIIYTECSRVGCGGCRGWLTDGLNVQQNVSTRVQLKKKKKRAVGNALQLVDVTYHVITNLTSFYLILSHLTDILFHLILSNINYFSSPPLIPYSEFLTSPSYSSLNITFHALFEWRMLLALWR